MRPLQNAMEMPVNINYILKNIIFFVKISLRVFFRSWMKVSGSCSSYVNYVSATFSNGFGFLKNRKVITTAIMSVPMIMKNTGPNV